MERPAGTRIALRERENPYLHRRAGQPYVYSPEQVTEMVACYIEAGTMGAARLLAVERERERKAAGKEPIYPNGRIPSTTMLSQWLADIEHQAAKSKSDKELVRETGVSRGVADKIAMVVQNQKRTLEDMAYSAAVKAMARTEEALPEASARDAAVAAGIMIDKLEQLRGIGGGRMSGQQVAVQIVLSDGGASI